MELGYQIDSVYTDLHREFNNPYYDKRVGKKLIDQKCCFFFAKEPTRMALILIILLN